MIEKLVRQNLKDFVPYICNHIDCKIKLDANESMYDLPEDIKLKLSKFIQKDLKINVYPDTNSVELCKAIASHYGINCDRVVIGVGSDQLIQIIYNTFIDSGDKVIIPQPSFAMFEISCKIAGGIPVKLNICTDKEYKYDVQKYIETIKKQSAKVAIVCTPNNPTGNIMTLEDIEKMVKACPETVIIIDEAYGEFAKQTAVSLTDKYENLIVLRTFSKAYGIAGTRVGYSISSSIVASCLNKVKPPYNQNTISQYIAKLVIQDKENNKKRIDEIIRQKDLLYEQLQEIHEIKVYPSYANFLLIKVKDSNLVYSELLKNGILVKNFGNSEGLENCLRISVGLEWQNKLLIKKLNNIL